MVQNVTTGAAIGAKTNNNDMLFPITDDTESENIDSFNEKLGI